MDSMDADFEFQKEVITRLTAIERTLDDTVHRLFGNGQPGIVEQHDRRISKLEQLSWKLFGALGAILTLIEVAMHIK